MKLLRFGKNRFDKFGVIENLFPTVTMPAQLECSSGLQTKKIIGSFKKDNEIVINLISIFILREAWIYGNALKISKEIKSN